MTTPKITWTDKEIAFLSALYGDTSVRAPMAPNHPGKAMSLFQERKLPGVWAWHLTGAFVHFFDESELPKTLSTGDLEWPWTAEELEARVAECQEFLRIRTGRQFP